MHLLAERMLAAFLMIAAVLAFVLAQLIENRGTSESPLQTFYIEGFARTFGEVSIFLIVAAGFSTVYAFSSSARRAVDDAATWVGVYLRNCSLPRYAFISCAAAALLLFLLNAPGILYGTFMIDDYTMYAIATERSVGELLWLPINDHVIPLFWLELKALFFLIGTNPPLLNFPLFVPAIVAIGGAAVLLRMLGFGPSTLAIFLGTFATTLVVSHQLYGFYAIAPYFQVLALFTLSLICFVRAQQKIRFARTFHTISLILLGMTLLLESGGIWTPAAYVLFVYAFEILKSGTWNIRATLRSHAATLITAVLITLIYVAYLIALPHYTTEPFFGFDRLPLSIETARELYHVVTAGTVLSLFAPRLGLILSQPRLVAFVMPWWHIAMFLIFCTCILLIIYALSRGSLRARVLVPFFFIVMLGTSLLTAIARPSSNPAAFFRDQNLLFPLFFLTLALTVFIHEWISGAPHKRSERRRTIVAVLLIVVVFGAQHTFSFYKESYVNDINFNRSLTERLNTTVTPALNELASACSPLAVPSLSGFFVRGNGYYQVPELSAFSSFIGVKNVKWLPIYKGPYGASTSPAFAEALKRDDRLRLWYLVNGELQENCTAKPFGKEPKTILSEKPVLISTAVNTAQKYLLRFDLEAHNAPEKIFIDLAFSNDFNATGTRGYIRLDQYTKFVDAPGRRYACTVDLNEIPVFALSPTVSNVTLTVTTPGEYRLNGIELNGR